MNLIIFDLIQWFIYLRENIFNIKLLPLEILFSLQILPWDMLIDKIEHMGGVLMREGMCIWVLVTHLIVL